MESIHATQLVHYLAQTRYTRKLLLLLLLFLRLHSRLGKSELTVFLQLANRVPVVSYCSLTIVALKLLKIFSSIGNICVQMN